MNRKPRNWYLIKVPGLPGGRRLRAEDEAQAARFFRMLVPGAVDLIIVPTTEADAFEHPLGE